MDSLLLRCRSHLIQMPIFGKQIKTVEAKKTDASKIAMLLSSATHKVVRESRGEQIDPYFHEDCAKTY